MGNKSTFHISKLIKSHFKLIQFFFSYFIYITFFSPSGCHCVFPLCFPVVSPRSGSTGLIHQRRTGETQQHRRCSNFWTHIRSFYISICLPTINVTFLIKNRSTLVVPWVKNMDPQPFGQGTARVLPLFSLPTWLDGPSGYPQLMGFDFPI